jgi:hypothetical protein
MQVLWMRQHSEGKNCWNSNIPKMGILALKISVFYPI